MRVDGLIIDPQIDFCDRASGTLYVPGADDDMLRLSDMVRRLGNQVAQYHVTLDSHHFVDVAHPIYWTDEQGNHPSPFTIITVSDLDRKMWTTTRPDYFDRSYAYVKALETGGRYPLCIWPYHCLVGSEGHGVVPRLLDALYEWEQTQLSAVNFVSKGSNPFTEHYSAIKAEVPDSQDPATQLNDVLLQKLRECDLLFVAGEALSHCIANTVRDIADSFEDDSLLSRMVLLTDAASSVQGFEHLSTAFLEEMTVRGMKTATTVDFLAST